MDCSGTDGCSDQEGVQAQLDHDDDGFRLSSMLRSECKQVTST